MERVRKLIRDVPDFPKDGILFRDITPLLEDPAGFARVVELLAERYRDRGITRIAGIESRGFIFGAPLALALGCGFSLIRKPGKLPSATHSVSYALEYGEDTLQMHQDTVSSADKVVIVDDLLATGGTAAAAVDLVGRCGAAVAEVAVIIELKALEGRAKIADAPVHALLTY